ncbi:hypothetical protein LTS18_001340, partial [Coniosporium uncinatum]
MAFLRQTWTLTRKNIQIVLVRHWFSTLIRAFVMPIIFMFFISYAKNFFVPPSDFGVGTPSTLRSLQEAINAASSSKTTVAFVNNGHTGGAIGGIIDQLSQPVRAAGLEPRVLTSDNELLTVCRSSLRGASNCYAAASFHSSPSEGQGGIWNYTIRGDGAFGSKVYVNEDNNDVQIYTLPLQHAIDSAIASANGTSLPATVEQYPYTTETAQERDDNIRFLYQGTLINILAVAFFIGICGILYQLAGQIATERELGMSQLIDAMTPNKSVWLTQTARMLSYHLSFDLIYLPGWIIMSVFVWRLVFPTTSGAIVIIGHLLAGLSLSSFSIFAAMFFRKAQLSGITIVLVSLVLAIIAQVTHTQSSGAVAILSLLFPPMDYVYFIILMARFERRFRPTNLTEGAPPNENSPWGLPGIVLWVFFIIHIIVYPILGMLVERSLYGTASKARKMNYDSEDHSKAIQLTGFSKHYIPSWWRRNVLRWFGKKVPETVKAVNNLTLTASEGQILVLLGANGSGKSTTLSAISGLTQITEGQIEVDGTGGLGLAPQQNVIWDELTVYEHVSIFNGLKTTTTPATKEEIKELIRACDLDHKMHAKSETLSGGQKRKLQLAMAFIGGSRVVAIDEVSSGLDPLSRRKIWDILLQERGFRTLLLTTHFLDEADTLADHIAILSKGHLKAEGSAVQLKHTLGEGYRVILPHDSAVMIPHHFSSVPHHPSYEGLVYRLQDSAQAAVFVDMLESQGIQDYQVNGPTIEDVFLKLAEEVKEDPSAAAVPELDDDKDGSPSRKMARSESSSTVAADEDHEINGTSSRAPNGKVAGAAVGQPSGSNKDLQLRVGRGTGVFRQAFVLFRKRLTILRRNWIPYFFIVIIPILAAALTTLLLDGFEAISCSPGAQSSNPGSFSISNLRNLRMPVGPPSAVSAEALAALAQGLGLPFANASSFQIVDTVEQFNQFIVDNYKTTWPGGFFIPEGSNPLFAYVGNWQLYTPTLTQNFMDIFLSGTPIVTQYQEFASPF